MKSYHILFTVFGVIGLLLAYAIWNVGLLKPVVIDVKELPMTVLVYKSVTGPYHKLQETFRTIEKLAIDNGWDCSKTFGIYHDDPNQAEQERLRADVGCYLESPPNGNVGDLIIKENPSTQALVGTFEGAPWLTAFKVYKALNREAQARKLKLKSGPIMEVYSPNGQSFHTQVIFELENEASKN